MYTPTITTTEQRLSGWGRCPVIKNYVQVPEQVASLSDVIQGTQHWPILARGGGRSYGDAALMLEGYTISTQRLNRILSFDPQTGILRCESGVTFQNVLERFIPQGWFPAVTPGTKFVTIGGAVAFDVHGKNHHIDSSFCHHVHSFVLILPSGEARRCSRQENRNLFWATVGGMGLTGIIAEVEFSLQPIATAYMVTLSIKAKNLDAAIALFEQYENQYQYSVAWMDGFAAGSSLGRSVLTFGHHAQLADLPPQQRSNPFYVPSRQRFKVPFDSPTGLLNHYTMRCVNTLYFHRQPSEQTQRVIDYDAYFYPLDGLEAWNRLYGKRGFVQYQFVVPIRNGQDALKQVLELCLKQGWGSFLAVLKRLGPQTGWLSFPMPGYTLALDLPVRPGLWEFLEKLDQIILQYDGRVYLAKDARLSPSVFRTMYPAFPRWLEEKQSVDPHNRFSSALSKRLQIGNYT